MKKKQINHFTELDAWIINHQVRLYVYRLTKQLPDCEKYGLISQTRRASISICGNISEGWGRFYFKDKLRFYYQARGSSCEVIDYLIFIRDNKFSVDEDLLKETQNLASRGLKLINGMIKSTAKQLNKAE